MTLPEKEADFQEQELFKMLWQMFERGKVAETGCVLSKLISEEEKKKLIEELIAKRHAMNMAGDCGQFEQQQAIKLGKKFAMFQLINYPFIFMEEFGFVD